MPPGHREGVAVGEPVLRIVIGQQVHRQDAAENAGIVDEKGRLPVRRKGGKENKRQQKQGHQPAVIPKQVKILPKQASHISVPPLP